MNIFIAIVVVLFGTLCFCVGFAVGSGKETKIDHFDWYEDELNNLEERQ